MNTILNFKVNALRTLASPYKKVGQNIATAGLLFALAYVLGVISSFVPIL